jgi:uncharacterized protein YjiS (DUF1127 family)
MRTLTSPLTTNLLEESARIACAYLPPAEEIDAYARRTLAANGFGDAAIGCIEQHQRLSSHAPHQTARADRSAALARALVAASRALGALVSRKYAVWRRQRLARVTYLALQRLDARTLRDLGLDRSELASITAELTSSAELTRARTIYTTARA